MVVCTTYNHESYIEDTLKGILMQQVDFPFVVCVIDDCSTDKTADILRKYEKKNSSLIKGFYLKENHYSQGKESLFCLLPWLDRIKYVAFCEGDDYWIDPLKLQKQVTLMDRYPECTLSFHSVLEHWEERCIPDKIFYPVEDRFYTGTEIFKQWIVATTSVMIRSNTIKGMKKEVWTNRSFLYIDIVFFLYCASVGKCLGISEVMAVYRRLEQGFTQTLHRSMRDSHKIVWTYCVHTYELYKTFGHSLGSEFKKEASTVFLHNVNGIVKRSIYSQEYFEAFKYLIKSIGKFPMKTFFFYLSYLKNQLS